MKPAIGIELMKVSQLAEDGTEFETDETNVEISGNREGLLRLAERIVQAANAGPEGYHVHLRANDEDPLMRTEGLWLTIGLHARRK